MSLVFHREDPPRIVILLLCCLVVSTGTVLAESSRIIGGHDSKWNVPDIGKPGNVIFSALIFDQSVSTEKQLPLIDFKSFLFAQGEATFQRNPDFRGLGWNQNEAIPNSLISGRLP